MAPQYNGTLGYSARAPYDPQPCPPLPVCPACGGLECLCHPRFFPGQLLTEEELSGLVRYIVAKNKLHNRYLVGWGVACGLEVLCNPCSGYVTVTSGYAISPCGDDIVVCKDESVDVCALIRACQVKQEWECDPPWAGAPDGCQDAEEEWQLAICYDEKPSRGITALRGSSGPACCSRCSCGGASACGCGCHEPPKRNGRKGYHALAPNPPPQCEPTLTCEGYKFIACKVVPKPREQKPSRGKMVDRFMECFTALQACLAPAPATDLNAVHAWCCSLRDCLITFLAAHPSHDCSLLQQVGALCPDLQSAGTLTGAQYAAAVQTKLIPIVTTILRDCFCSSFLPPCPEPVEKNCVVLAQLTVRRTECQVLRVCNFEGRKFLVTLPNLGYWLSPLPFGAVLREAVDRFCCPPPPKG